MATWHLMFQKPAFLTPQIQHIVEFLRQTGSFGGFPINRVSLVRDTSDLAYLDLDFKITAAITQPTFTDMCKYMLVVAGGLEGAPMPVYFAIMQHTLDELSITYHIYDAHTADIYYWQAPPIQAAPEPDDRLRFR
ncbi:hypothetical protein ACFQ5J_09750 [Lacticaseibacillus baoqingensis]|uniref:Uncharacterized protein n=1 Tax=Lacticaseibacillus baoqingensis TaxID=2486013 RepID=A0ABW4EAR6_9LACO|nr:hypothetical protein [Lacticaseibacillus baoqingensis]